MALTVETQDLENYPGIVKSITIDTDKIVPTGYDGDEQFMTSFTTTAYSDNENLTSIQDLYITDLKVGWFKSSGFTGSSGKFALTASARSFKIKMDNTVSGTDGNGYYTVTLDYNTNGTPKFGEDIASDMETKIRALSLETADAGYSLAYRNATVEFKDNKFYIYSGTMGSRYYGNNRTSVDIIAATSNDCTEVLGFDLGSSSETLAQLGPRETLVTQNYTVGDTSLYIQTGTSFEIGDCCVITDNTNKDYFVVVSGTGDTIMTVPASGVAGSIAHSYLANKAKVQILKEQDPDGEPKMYYDSIDKVCRHGIELVMSQIDYSS